MIPIGSLKDDYYMLDEDNYQVIGRRHGRCYKLGYPVHIRVRRVDMLKKQIDFEGNVLQDGIIDYINNMFNRCNGNNSTSHRVELSNDTGLHNLR